MHYKDFDQQHCIKLGLCTKPHGLRGLASAELFNQDPDSILSTNPDLLLVQHQEQQIQFVKKIKVSSFVQTPKKAIIGFEGVGSIEELNNFIPCEIWIEKKNLPKLRDGQIYLEDLRHMAVIDSKTGLVVGRVSGTYQVAQQTVVSIESKNNENFDIPLIQNFIVSIDHEQKILKINMPVYEDA